MNCANASASGSTPQNAFSLSLPAMRAEAGARRVDEHQVADVEQAVGRC